MSRTIVITGAGAGIGLRGARAGSPPRGWTLCATDVNREPRRPRSSRSSASEHTYAQMDVTDKDGGRSASSPSSPASTAGAFDALLNNAGVAFIQNFEDADRSSSTSWSPRSTSTASLNCTYLAFPYLSKATDAKVINMCSLSVGVRRPERGDLLGQQVLRPRLHRGDEHRVGAPRHPRLRRAAQLRRHRR